MEFSGIVFELVRNLMSFGDNLDMVCKNMCLTWTQKIISAKKKDKRISNEFSKKEHLSSTNYKRTEDH